MLAFLPSCFRGSLHFGDMSSVYSFIIVYISILDLMLGLDTFTKGKYSKLLLIPPAL